MYKEKKSLGIDLSTNEQITKVVIYWEPEKETAEEFLRTCALLYPEKEQHIMHGCVHVYLRDKVIRTKEERDESIYDTAGDYIQPKKPKKSRF